MLAAFILVAGPWGPSARGDPAERLADAYEAALRGASAGQARALLDDRALALLVKDPISCALVCGLTELYARVLAMQARRTAPEEVEALIARVMELAERTQEAAPLNGRSHRAMAYALVARGRAWRGLLKEADGNWWFQAAWHTRRCALLDPQYIWEELPAAQGYIEEGAIGDPTDRLAVLREAFESRARSVHQGGVTIETRLDVGQHALAAAEAALAKGDRKSAGEALSLGLDLLAGHPEGTDSHAVAAGLTYNNLLRLAHSLRVETPRDFRVQRLTSRWNYLAYDRPVGWAREYGKSDDKQLLDRLTRHDREGLTFVELHTYHLTMDYYDNDNQRYGGDNLSGLADMNRKFFVAGMGKVSQLRKSLRGRLNEHVAKTHGFEIKGEERGLPVWYRGWVFKGTHRDRSYFLLVHKFGGDAKCDPELERLISSIHEIP